VRAFKGARTVNFLDASTPPVPIPLSPPLLRLGKNFLFLILYVVFNQLFQEVNEKFALQLICIKDFNFWLRQPIVGTIC
jgi:hypothetical protein